MFTALVEEYLEMSSPELDEVVRVAEAEIRAAKARMAAAVAVVDGRQSYRDEGHYSVRAYLKAHTNCSGVEANRIRKRAALVNEFADIGDAWLNGHVGTDHVDTLTKAHAHRRAGDRFREFEPILLDHAEHLEHVDFDKVVDRFIVLADTDGAFDDQQFQEDERSASVAVVNGAVDVRASGGDALAAAEIDAVFKLACEAEFGRDCAARRAEFGDDALQHPLPRTTQQRKFDAMHQIFLAWATVPSDGITPEPLVNILIDQKSAAETLGRHGLVDDTDVFAPDGDQSLHHASDDLLARRCATSTGVPLHPDVAMQAMIRGHVRRVVVDSAGVVIDLGRTRRLFTGKARDAAQLLVLTCSHPGCDVPAEFCDVDHLDEWAAHKGPTDQRNGGPACGGHDRFKHEHQLRARRTASGRVRLIRPDGTVIKPVGERDPVWADEHRPSRPPRPLLQEHHLVSWNDFIRERPQLADEADSGWLIHQLHVGELPHRPR